MAGENVLVVEDERILAMHMRQQLLKLGYTVSSVAFSGDQAIQQARQYGPDAILMDIHIDGDIDGIQTAALIGDELNIPIIYVTAYSEEATLKRARATKPFGYLIKPFTERELHATIQMALERRAVEIALRRSKEHLSLALDAAEMGSWDFEASTQRIRRHPWIDPTVADCPDGFFGTVAEIMGRVETEDQAPFADRVNALLSRQPSAPIEFRIANGDGQIRWLKIQGRSFATQFDRDPRIIGVVQDVTQQRIAEVRLSQAEILLRTTQDGIVILSSALEVLAANRGFCDITGHDEATLLGHTLEILAPAIHRELSGHRFESSLATAGYWRNQFQMSHRNGTPLSLIINVTPINSGHRDTTRYVAVFSDMTAIRRAERDLEHLAHYDPLTDLPNRFLAMDRLDQAIASHQRDQERVGLMFVDLDHFKDVNDTLGHSAGDELLRIVAGRMRDALRSEDTVARLGGDEFMIILTQIDSIDEIAGLARRLLACISDPTAVPEGRLSTSASIGISLYPGDGNTREELIRAADTAMYEAKAKGRNTFAFYTEEMTQAAIFYFSMARDLRRGLADGELRLYYQPQFSIESGALTGVEALIRWQHRDEGLRGAASVIPIAERSGLIVEIGEWVIREACRQAQDWRQAGLAPVRIAINVSPSQIRDDRLSLIIGQALQDFDIQPAQLEVEITETVLQNGPDCIEQLQRLKEIGIMLSIDDFGTGYSCLSSLKTMPIQRIKIDQSFIQGIPDNHDNVAITEAIVAIAHRLGLLVLAEGVETVEQLDFLRGLGCEESQGYYHARPLPPQALADQLRRWGATTG